jgi:Protein of unknown function (DUF2490)
MIKQVTGGILAMMLALCASAARADEDGQFWSAANATIDLQPDLFLWLEGQTRFTDDAERFGQILLRPAVGYRFDPTTSAMVGYVYFENRPLGRASSNSQPVWQVGQAD